MSIDNNENTRPIRKRSGSTPTVQESVMDHTSDPGDSLAETKFTRRKNPKIQADASASTAETSKISSTINRQQAEKLTPSTTSEPLAVQSDTSSTQPAKVVKAKPATKPPAAQPESPAQPPAGKDATTQSSRVKRGRWIWLGILMVIVMTLAGSGIGYASAMRAREIEENNQRLLLATTQFELAQADMLQGKLEIAQDRFEYVLSIYPDFPGIDEKLVEVGLLIGQSQGGNYVPTPGPGPTPTVAITVVPTKSTGSTTLLFNQAVAQLEGQDWEGLFSTITAMREIDPAYKAVEVDGMWYLALRNRGIRQIQAGNLEPGLYSFALAEHIAPLDTDAESYRTWARMYLNAGSFWQVDWYRAVEGFAALYPLVPQLRDASGINVTQRYSRALAGYGDFLQQNYDYCGAASSYRQASSIYSDESLPGKITQADEFCANPPPTPTPTVDPSAPTPTPTP